MIPFCVFQRFGALTYPVAKKFLFRLEAERAHHLTLLGLRALQRAHLISPPKGKMSKPIEIMGIRFPNRLGLAAGMDKAGQCVDGFLATGFGHVEIGTVTPRPQPGNPKPRLFRLIEHGAVINRMGFNNPGVAQALTNLKKRRFPGVIGVNIGKNFDTPNDQALEDYLTCLRLAHDHADYITVNLSSPNTKGLRDLQAVDQCRPLLEGLIAERDSLRKNKKKLPLAIKVAPDLPDPEISALGSLFNELKIDAVIATNTTISRAAVQSHPLASETGGLSGHPVGEKATEVIARFRQQLDSEIPIIGVGGIMNGQDARKKLEAGASLLQIDTGLIYRGPELVQEILDQTRSSA
ncbi:MAG: quinone-dependent dihydroorotate dehydrogenase [Verrucomicrobiota bacterium]